MTRVRAHMSLGIAALLLLFVLFAGPTLMIFTDFGQGLLAYAKDIIPLD